MRPIAPRLNHPAAEELDVAEEQHEYQQLTMARVLYADASVQMIGRWTFTPTERARIAAGEDVYVSFPNHTFPHTISLRPDWAGRAE